MKPEAKVKVGLKSKQQAEIYLRLGNLGRAFAHYLVALKLIPECKNELKTSFSSTLCAWGEHLESQFRYSDLFKCYEQAIEIFPENEEVLGNLGAHLFRLGHFHEASHYFRQALQLNCDYLAAYRNLQSINNLLVERWHFRMLNDNNRNEAYREAILKKVKQGFNSVLDIGTGTGIFSLFSVNAGAQHVYACDCSETMCDIAKQVLEANNVSDRVKVMNKLSNDLQVPKHIPQKVSLVVTETMDAGLFGEHLVQTLIHAWETLLLPPHPYLSTIYDLAHSKSVQEYGIVIPFGATLWAAPIQCDYIARKNFIVNHCGEFDLSKIVMYAERDEPYDTENLQNLKEFKTLTKPLQIKKIDFNNPSQLMDYFKGKCDSVVSFPCSSKSVDAVAVWFDIHLDEDITLSSSPFHPDANTCCWDQAIFPIRPSREGDFELKFKFKDGKLAIEECTTVKNCEDTESLASLFQSSLGECSQPVYPVSSEIIQFLNNKTLCERFISLPSELIDKQIKFVLDLSPFPLAGVGFISLSQSRVISVLKSNNDIIAVRELARKNNIDLKKLECITEDNLEEFLDSSGFQFDLVINSLVESTGELKERSVAILTMLKKHLRTDGMMLPQTLSVCCCLVESDWLTRTSRVVDEDIVDTYKIAQYINKYQVAQHLDIDLNKLKYTVTSEPTECLVLNIDTINQTSALLKELAVSSDFQGRINAIPYWFQYKMLQHDQRVISTFSSDSNVNQAVMLVEPVCVQPGDKVLLRVDCQSGILRFAVLPTSDCSK